MESVAAGCSNGGLAVLAKVQMNGTPNAKVTIKYLKIAVNQKATQPFDWSYSHAEARVRPRPPLYSPPETLSVQGQDKMVAFRQWKKLFYAVPLRWLDTQVLWGKIKINRVNRMKELNSSLAHLLPMKRTADSRFKPWCRQNGGVAEVPEIAHIWPIFAILGKTELAVLESPLLYKMENYV